MIEFLYHFVYLPYKVPNSESGYWKSRAKHSNNKCYTKLWKTRHHEVTLRTLHVVCHKKLAKYLQKICKKFAKNLRKICEIFAKYSQKIREKFAKNSRKINIREFFRIFSRIFRKYFANFNFSRIFREYFANISRIFCKFFANFSQIFRKFFAYFSRIFAYFSRIFRKFFANFSRIFCNRPREESVRYENVAVAGRTLGIQDWGSLQ